MKKYYKTIVLSDIHLGIKASKAKEVLHFLKNHKCDTLLLNGDIIDGWQLKKNGKWKKQHSNFIKHIISLVTKGKCQEIIYLRGNHDDFLDEMMPFSFSNFKIKRQHIHYGVKNKYYVIHGDIFDSITTKFSWLAKLGDTGYTFLLWLNRHYNNYRAKKGLPYFSMSQAIKAKVKTAVNFVNGYEQQLTKVARSKKCAGIICGHIHQPAIKMIDEIEYLNSGDWVESLTALVEETDGTWKIIHYTDWIKGFYEAEKEKELHLKKEDDIIADILIKEIL